MSFALRDYQQAVVDTTLAAVDSGTRAAALQLATGAGKTVILAELARRRRHLGRTLLLAHREELVEQLARTVGAHVGCPVGIEQGGSRVWFRDPVVVASIPSVGRDGGRRLARLDPREFATVCIDEVHHAVPANGTYAVPLQWAGIVDAQRRRTGAGPVLLGCSATLRRSDGRSLAPWFDAVTADVPLRWLIDAGHLVDFRAVRLRSRVSLDGVPVRNGDFVAAALEAAVNVEARNALAVEHYLAHARERQFLAFASGVAHAHELARSFERAGVACEAVDGTTPKPRRRAILEAYRRGRLEGLVNVGVFTEGTDLPMIGAVYLLRPTQSALVYSQMVGRGSRKWSRERWNAEHPAAPWEGERHGLAPVKPDCLLVDLVDVCTRHALVHAPSLTGRGYDGEVVNSAARRNAMTVGAVPTLTFEAAQAEAIDPHAAVVAPALWQWTRDADGWHLLLPDGGAHVLPQAGRFAVSFDGLDLPDTSHRTALLAFAHVDSRLRGRYARPTLRLAPAATAAAPAEPHARWRELRLRTTLTPKQIHDRVTPFVRPLRDRLWRYVRTHGDDLPSRRLGAFLGHLELALEERVLESAA